ncbi:MAG: nicotinate (nicotinamide) nucleotide adenylyltransferase [Eubacterium sp.]|nr:nicotinate (nicotinamide) nucleotide adenylyltransferase [Eubacterium sp.]
MKIGIFGGAFNPIHNGHLALAENYYESLHLDKIIFIPTSIPPHKTADYLVSQNDRLEMVRLATQDNSSFEVSDIEFHRQGKSYTYDTLLSVKELYPDSEIYLIIGADQFLTFHLWYKYKEILDMVTLCTSARENEQEKQELYDYAKSLDGLEKDKYFIANYPVIRFSSSEIRDKIKNGEEISALVPKRVCEYIFEKGLYSV